MVEKYNDETYKGYTIKFIKKPRWRDDNFPIMGIILGTKDIMVSSWFVYKDEGSNIYVRAKTKEAALNAAKSVINKIEEQELIRGQIKGEINRTPVKGALKYDTEKYRRYVERLISEHNRSKYYDDSGVIIFPSYKHAHIWLDEITGQISDGKYENRNSKWKWFSGLRVSVSRSLNSTKIVTKYKPSHVYMSFKDLIWLFDEKHAFDDKKSSRAVFSHMPYDELKDILNDIGKAVNRKIKD